MNPQPKTTGSVVALRGKDLTVDIADKLSSSGKLDEALDVYLHLASKTEVPSADLCVKLGRCYLRRGEENEGIRWLLSVVDDESDYAAWQQAGSAFERVLESALAGMKRTARIAVLGSSTTVHFTQLLRLAGARFGIALDIFQADYGQVRQELLNPESRTYEFDPDVILLAVDPSALGLPSMSEDPRKSVEEELSTWTTLWQCVASHSRAHVLQFNFPVPPDEPLGHLGTQVEGARSSMIREVNRRLGKEAGRGVSLVDCERLSATIGKRRWFDPRFWYLAKEAVAFEALPLLAKHTAAVLAGSMGLTRKCLVLDLDNTLWGGVIGEDGMAGIRLGHGAEGEAFVAFQDYVLDLKRKGVILAICSKNNEEDALRPFQEHPEMRIRLEDIAMFVANWESKPENLREIARTLNIGLDAIVFADDNPVEREAVRRFVPEVDVILLPADPARYVEALSTYLRFETSEMTEEDSKKTEQYRARAQSIQLQKSAASLEEFHSDLQMKAAVAAFDEFHLARIVQLVGKTNQFNLTTRRYGLPEVRAIMNNPDAVHFYVRLTDRFTDHGLVGLMVALRHEDVMEIDTWLMSCRVIGRTVESLMLDLLSERAVEFGCTKVKGTYIPTAKNKLVKGLYQKLGFDLLDDEEGRTTWLYDLEKNERVTNPHIEVEANWEVQSGLVRTA